MADLTAPLAGRPGDGGDRAQIILIAGFALAVTLVALALVTNAAIYTENLATRSESAGLSDAHSYERATERAALEAFEFANENHAGDKDALAESVVDAIDEYDRVSTSQEVTTGRVVEATTADMTNGTHITNDNTDFEKPGDDGNGNWTVAEDVDDTRRFTLAVEGWNDTQSREFRVVADNPTSWYLNVSKSGGVYEVGVTESGTYTSCGTFTPRFELDLVAGTISEGPDEFECEALKINDELSDSEIKFENGTRVDEGSYSIITDGDSNNAPSEDVLYNMTVDLLYQTEEVRYETALEIEPQKPDNRCGLQPSDVNSNDIEQVVECDVRWDPYMGIKSGGTIIGDAESYEGDIDIDDGTVYGTVDAEGDIDLDSSKVTGDITGDGDDIVVTDDSTVEANITSLSGNIDIDGGSTVNGSISADDQVSVSNAEVTGNVNASTGKITIDGGSTVEGDVLLTDPGNTNEVDLSGVTIEGDVYLPSGAGFSCSSSTINGESCSEYSPKDLSDY